MKEYDNFINVCYKDLSNKNELLNEFSCDYDGIKYDAELYNENIDFFNKTRFLPSSKIRNTLIHELIKRNKKSIFEIESLLRICKNNLLLEKLITEETGFTKERYASFYKSNLTPTEKQMINEMTSEIEMKTKSIEEKVSAIMKSLQEENVKLVGFENRFKSSENISRSLIKVITEFPNITIEEAILSICDALRYTLVLNEENYQKKVLEKIQVLKNLGYEITHLKNAWGNPIYQGINVGFKNKNDIEFEVQFHTETSYMVKEKLNHIYYEISRNNNASQEARFLSAEIMKETQELFVKTVKDALCINISYVNNSMIKYRIYTDSEVFKKKYKEETEKWHQNNKIASETVKAYITDDIKKIGCYCTMNSILRGIFRKDKCVNILKIGNNNFEQYTEEEFENIVKMSVDDYEKETLKKAANLNDAINQMELVEDTVMYRGININALEKYNIDIDNDSAESIYKKITKEGYFYMDYGFMSATPILDEIVSSQKIILIMNCKEKTKGLDLSTITDENAEFLFPMNSKFHIDTVTKENNKVYIHVSSL